MVRRNFIFDTIKGVFRKYGYRQIETPAMENISTLTGKYGDEGDKLIFKILNSGNFIDQNELSKFTSEVIERIWKAKEEATNSSSDSEIEIDLNEPIRNLIEAEKALRYDLTVPFARYVVMHQNEITFPFKRFQVQPVWRADRPQKGRYREFYQCDADVVGSDSLINEAEFILIYDEALTKLGLKDFTIKINNRKILSGIAELIDKVDNIVDMTVAIDKLDKIGLNGVINELLGKGFTENDIKIIEPVILLQGSNTEKLEKLRAALANSPIGLKGCDEVEEVLNYLASCRLQTASCELDITLARGLNYYTGAIFEVKTNEVSMGSIGGGGRYDDLTGMFGLKGLTGVGISFGADRIYDVMEELNIFPAAADQATRLLICCMDKEGEQFAFPILQQLRRQDVNAELYPAGAKLKKQLDYANNNHIPYTIIIGSQEMQTGLLTVKNMETGVQEKLTVEQVVTSFGR
ncbi:MAG: histidine--tRNA ligase [Mucilaginibacter sp.]|nr:histidine--tRNA ligase [Mucilaginibacter sp.]